jgi:hypothetical protein
MRWWVGFAGVIVASAEIFVACSSDTTPPNDASMDGMMDGTLPDTASGDDLRIDVPDASGNDSPADASADSVLDSGCDASATDPRNCGRCGHDCVGGACSAGVCQPWTILSTPASDIASDNARVFWVLGAIPGDLSTCSRGGCDAGTTLAGNLVQPGKIALDSTRAYFTTYVLNTGILGACAKGGCDGGATTLSGNHSYPAWLVVDSTDVYYNVYNGDLVRCTLPSCAPDGGVSITTTSVAQGLAQDSTNLFWSEGYQYLVSCQKSNCNGTRKIIISGESSLRSVAAYGGNVYAVESGANGRIIRCPNATNCNPTVMAQNLDDADDIEVDSTGIYFVLHGSNPATNGSLAYCPIGGCMGTPQTLIGNLSYTNAVGIDQDAVYIVSSGSPIMGIAKP